MTNPAARAVHLAAAAVGTQSRQYADAFVSTQWAIVELAEAARTAVMVAGYLQAARLEGKAGIMAERLRQLDRHLKQAMQLSEAAARVVEAHIKRERE
jgi:hypothetical protein